LKVSFKREVGILVTRPTHTNIMRVYGFNVQEDKM